MTPTPKFKDWHQVLAAVITILGGIAIMWMQANRAIDENQRLLREFTIAVHDSKTMREMIEQPLEGRWKYEVDWSRYFRQKSAAEGEDGQRFASEGIAHFRWAGDSYDILLGYVNRDVDSRFEYSVGVAEGDINRVVNGLPTIGTIIDFSYKHRMGSGSIGEGEDAIDNTSPPESSFRVKVTSLEFDQTGEVAAIHGEFLSDISDGAVVFMPLE